MLIQGNDERGINVGLMTKEGFEFVGEHTHVFDLDDKDEPIFSRDCIEYTIRNLRDVRRVLRPPRHRVC